MVFFLNNLIYFLDLTVMNELTNNKTTDEGSRIFSTTEKTKVEVEGYMNPREAWECMEHQIKYAYKIEDGLLDVIDRLQIDILYKEMAIDGLSTTVDDFQKENEKLNKTIEDMYWESVQKERDFEEQLWEQKMGDDL